MRPCDIRPIEEGDLAATGEIIFAAFGKLFGDAGMGSPYPTPADAEADLRRYFPHLGRFGLVAVERGTNRIVGYNCVVHVRGRMGGCGPIAVAPDYWGTGVFMALLAPQRRLAREAGVEIIRGVQDSINTKNFGFYYQRMGFDPLEISPVLRRRWRPNERGGGRFEQVSGDDLRLIRREDLPKVVELDRHAFFDGDRTPEFEMFLSEHPGFMIERGGHCEAFGFLSGRGQTAYLSPLGALDPADAKRILLAATKWAAENGRMLFMAPMASDRPFVEEAFKLGFELNHIALFGELRLDGAAPFQRKGIYAMTLPPSVP